MERLTCIIFAGGAGTRLWPMSRKNSPKQFASIKQNQSTLQMAVERISYFGLENLYISTNAAYAHLVKEQVPDLLDSQVFLEPAKRDQGPAVGLTLLRLKQQGITGPIAILWSDHLMDHPDSFRDALSHAGKLVEQQPNRFIFLGETPRFPNHNLGWMHIGKKTAEGTHEFLGWKYRPEVPACKELFESKEWLWNTGYFVTDIDFLLDLYKRLQPELYSALLTMAGDESLVERDYGTLPAISFDNAIIEKTDLSEGAVLSLNLGWSDPGTLYAFKEAFAPDEKSNYAVGQTIDLGSTDSFIYNEEPKKLVSTIGLEGMIVVNTKDAILVCKKEDVPRLKELLKKIEEEKKESYL